MESAGYNWVMNGEELDTTPDLCAKIARLVEERGWNQEEFARLAQLNRLTVRRILHGEQRRLHNATISACARALGVSVNELRQQNLGRLLTRMAESPALPVTEEDAKLRRRFEEVTQPELLAWIERNPERAARLSPDEMDEVLSLQGTGGPLTAFGVAHYVELLERKRALSEKVLIVAGTEYFDMLEQFVGLLYEKIQPYRDRGVEAAHASPFPPATK